VAAPAAFGAAAALGAPGPTRPVRAPQARLVQPSGLALTAAGELLITDVATHRLLRLDAGGRLQVLAGTGEGGFAGDGGPAAAARLFAPHDVAVDPRGRIYLADTYNRRIRRIDERGIITTVAGGGPEFREPRAAGDGGPAIRATLNNPQGIALAPDGRLFIADTFNYVVRCVDPQGRISTFAGSEPGLAGDGGPAVRAQLSLPTAVTVAPDGAVLICEAGNNRIRKVSPSGIISTLAGSGPGSGNAGAGFAGDGGPVAGARLFAPVDLETCANGDLIFSDSGNHRVRIISNGTIRTLAGSGDDGGGARAPLSTPRKIAVSSDGTVFVADSIRGRIRRIDPGGQVRTVEVKGEAPGHGAPRATPGKRKP
jgi:sugar lactone lactonase YvrE